MLPQSRNRRALAAGVSLLLALLGLLVVPAPASAAEGDFVYVREFGHAGTDNGGLDSPRNVDVGPDGDVWVVDNVGLTRFGPDGRFRARFSTGLSTPRDVVVLPDGSMYVANDGMSQVQRYEPNGNRGLSWGSPGNANGQFQFMSGIDADAQGRVYVADANGVQVFSPQGVFERRYVTGADFLRPALDVAVNADGSSWVLRDGKLSLYAADGSFVRTTVSNIAETYHLDKLGDDILVANLNGARQYRPDGTVVRDIGLRGVGPGLVSRGWGVAVSTAGSTPIVYVVDNDEKVLAYQATAAPRTPSPASLPTPSLDAPYDAQLDAGGFPVPTWSVTAGSLPPGLTVSAGGRLSGTPTAAGPATFTLTAANAVGSASRTFTVSVPPREFTSRPTVSVAGAPKVGQTLTASTQGAFAPAATSTRYQWLVDDVPVPGATAATWVVGADAVGGRVSVAVTGLRDTFAPTTVTSAATGTVGGSVSDQAVLRVELDPAGPAVVGDTVTVRISGLSPYESFTSTVAGVPFFSGVAAVDGSSTRLYHVTTPGSLEVEAVGEGADRRGRATLLALEPAAPTSPMPAVLPAPVLGRPYAAQLLSSGAPEPTFRSRGALPAGLSLRADGLVTGTPTAAGASTFEVIAANARGEVARTYSLEVPALVLPPCRAAVTGVLEVGRELATSLDCALPTGAQVAWTWSRDGRDLPDASGPSYVPTADDVGALLTARARITADNYVARLVESAAVGPVAGNTTGARSLEVTLDAAGPRPAGASAEVRARGLAALEEWVALIDGRVVARGRASRSGELRATVRLPAPGLHQVQVTGASAERTGTARVRTVAVRARLRVSVSRQSVAPGNRVLVRVRGLAPGETVTATEGGRRVGRATAGASGVATISVRARRPLARHVVVVTGVAPGRTGRAGYRVR